MGADGVMSVSVSRSGALSSPDVPLLHQYLSLEHISFGTPKYTRSGELRRALGVSLGSASEDLPFRASNFRPSPPVAPEELKQIRESVSSTSAKARERSQMLRESSIKLEKYMETMGSKKRQRTDILSNEKPGGSSLLKMAGQPRNLADLSAQRLEDKAKCAGMNKRFRTSGGDLRVDSKSGSLLKDQIGTEKDINIIKPANRTSIPEERMLRLSAVGDSWDKNMMKRKRSVGTVPNRSVDSDIKRTLHSEPSTNSKLASYDTSTLRLSGRSNAKQGTSTGGPATLIKGKISRAPRTGSVMVVNSSSDVHAPSEVCEGWEQPTSTNKVISLDSMQNNHRAANSSHILGQWVVQRQQKSSRSRRSNVVSPVSNHDDGQLPSVKYSPPVIGAKNSLNGSVGCLESVDLHNNNLRTKVKVESMASPGIMSEGEEMRGLELKLEEKGTDCSDVVLTGKGKMRAFIIPTKRNKNVLNENVGDGVRRQGRTVRGLSLSSPGLSPSEPKLENVSTAKRIQSTKPGSEKIKSKSGRPPSRKMSDGRTFSRNSIESDDDREELLAAAAAARKASHISCSGRFWKKMEPIFGTASSQDVSYMKQQLSLAEELEDSLSVIPGAQYNILGVFMHKEKVDVSSGKKGCDSNEVVDKDELLSEGLAGGNRLDKFSSLYHRVLSALIDEDENEGTYNGNEGVSMSLQCASDDSHCGSCNYVDADVRDRDRFDSEAESMVDVQIQKRCSGDRFSCNKSVTSNTTRNASMSDSLYSSGRWLGDDGLSHSDAEFVSGNWQNDVGGPQPSDVSASGTFLDPQYQLMCIDDRLMLELQSVGLYLDTMPDLADREEVIDRDITELREGLCEQTAKKKDNLVKIDKAIEDDRKREKPFMEHLAMEQLMQMAYKRRMACRRNNGSKTVMRKVSKQVAMGFIERTLVRCKNFELTGRSCFSEPALQNVLFAATQVNGAGACTATDSHTGHGAPNRCVDTAKADFSSFSVLDSCTNDFGRGYLYSPQGGSCSSERGYPEFEPLSHKGKKRELLLDDVGVASSRGAMAFGSSVVGGPKAKRSERDRNQGRSVLAATAAGESQSVVSFSSDQKPKTKPKNPTSTVKPMSSAVQWQNTEHNKRRREIGLSSGNAPEDARQKSEEHIDFDPIEQLDISNDPNAPEDFNNWLTGLQDYDSIGLEIPMDDLNMVLM
ncbi:uncharacterized protein [Spinacia oleracea]|uniref:DUF3741 domain-containing protein n=1 Tax=Spinacia oleracea TaxID=3562 RepID=A0A9R0IZQ3_SPIOL|nr:uncharacterized protein LOC110797840 [Spinacia oleracea]XP_021858657.2 uncharacterized protein LOC110797840 [Spinacia oleracea]XP_021858658.2 uncharacterized protein LOC110797840 [Spinacia oleracea]